MKVSTEKIKGVKGLDISIIILENNNGHIVKLMDYGAAILEILVPDRNGKIENIVLGYKNIEDYIECITYFGMTCGRTSGRIANGRFKIDGKEYVLKKNENGLTNLHGGIKGFSYKIWDYEIFKSKSSIGVKFYMQSPHMEEGYPGDVRVEAVYTLDDNNELTIDYNGSTDRATLLNMTNHSYFNLSGDYKRPITDEYLFIDADRFIELDKTLIGIRVRDVEGTPMDFTKSKLVGKDINNPYLKNHTANGYDHPWILNHREIKTPQAILKDEMSGRVMEVYTTYPSIVVYSFNYPKGELLKGDIISDIHYSLCLETQYEPNGINYPGLNDSILRSGEVYKERTVFKFSIE